MAKPDPDELAHYGDDAFDDDEEDGGFDCGRWFDGRLTHSCARAGTEECDFECPHRDTLYR